MMMTMMMNVRYKLCAGKKQTKAGNMLDVHHAWATHIRRTGAAEEFASIFGRVCNLKINKYAIRICAIYFEK